MEITLDNLTYSYPSAHTDALSGVSARIGSGMHLLLGENGAGKTTLLHLIAGLRYPTSGRCLIDGGPTRLRLPSVLSQVCFMGAGQQFPAATLAEMVRCHAQFFPRFSADTLRDNLQAFGLTDSVRLASLSMGMRQKAAVAYALSLHTPLLLLDEPATGLDIESRQALQQMVARCVTDDQTVIVSTHSIAELQYLYDGVMVLSGGHLLVAMSTADVLSRVAFVTTSSFPPVNALYSENALGQCRSIVPNPGGEIDSDMDYRLLYIALRHDPQHQLTDLLTSPSAL